MIEGELRAAPEGTIGRPRRRALVLAFPAGFGLRPWIWLPAAFLVLLGTLSFGTGFFYGPIGSRPPTLPAAMAGKAPEAFLKDVVRLRAEKKGLEGSLRQKTPRGTHIVIDQTQNRLFVRKDGQVVLEAKCSAGSGMVLSEEGGKERRWVFDTPRGQFRVLSKMANPVWKKPDWAFVEEGKPIPKDPEERFEAGTLGEYALYFGNGYMIHGTLYERLLGRSVTHGCIRLGRDDLRVVWKEAPVGTPIYIY